MQGSGGETGLWPSQISQTYEGDILQNWEMCYNIEVYFPTARSKTVQARKERKLLLLQRKILQVCGPNRGE